MSPGGVLWGRVEGKRLTIGGIGKILCECSIANTHFSEFVVVMNPKQQTPPHVDETGDSPSGWPQAFLEARKMRLYNRCH